jgi:hypothetical protein
VLCESNCFGNGPVAKRGELERGEFKPAAKIAIWRASLGIADAVEAALLVDLKCDPTREG